MNKVEKQSYPNQVHQLRQQLLEAAQEPKVEKIIVNQNLASSLFSQPEDEFFQKLDENKLFILLDKQRNQIEINLLHRTLNYSPESISDISRLAKDPQARGNQIMRWYQEIYGGLQTQNWDQVSTAYNLSAQSLTLLDQHDFINLPDTYHDFIQSIADYQPAKKDQQNKFPLGYLSEGKEAQNYLSQLFSLLRREHPAQYQLLTSDGLTPDNALQTLSTEHQYPDF